MGLCKCPKRKVTNQFCYEHRVNVCEYCMVTNHPQCVVQSYLQWLEDNDYNAICDLCRQQLNVGSCIRLICYHVFHQHCLHEMGQQRLGESGTQLEKFCCPTCAKQIFPPSNMVSPVADALNDVLMKANWARQVLGLPELPESMIPASVMTRPEPLGCISAGDPREPGIHVVAGKQRSMEQNSAISDPFRTQTSEGTSFRRLFDFSESNLSDEASIPMVEDENVNKYKRRSTKAGLVLKWWSDLIRPHPRLLRDPSYKKKRIATFIVLGVVALFLLVKVLSWLGEIPDDDPNFDVKQNPFVNTA